MPRGLNSPFGTGVPTDFLEDRHALTFDVQPPVVIDTIIAVSSGTSTGTATLVRTRTFAAVSTGSSTGIVTVTRNTTRALTCVSGGSSSGTVVIKRNRALSAISTCSSTGIVAIARNRKLIAVSTGSSTGTALLLTQGQLIAASTGASTGIVSVNRSTTRNLTCRSTGSSTGTASIIRTRGMYALSDLSRIVSVWTGPIEQQINPFVANSTTYTFTGFGADIPVGTLIVVARESPAITAYVNTVDNSTQPGNANVYTQISEQSWGTTPTIIYDFVICRTTRKILTTDTITITQGSQTTHKIAAMLTFTGVAQSEPRASLIDAIGAAQINTPGNPAQTGVIKPFANELIIAVQAVRSQSGFFSYTVTERSLNYTNTNYPGTGSGFASDLNFSYKFNGNPLGELDATDYSPFAGITFITQNFSIKGEPVVTGVANSTGTVSLIRTRNIGAISSLCTCCGPDTYCGPNTYTEIPNSTGIVNVSVSHGTVFEFITAISTGSSAGIATLVRNRAQICPSGGGSSGTVGIGRKRTFAAISTGTSTGVATLIRNRALTCVSGGSSSGTVTIARNRALICNSNGSSSGTVTIARNRRLICVSGGTSTGVTQLARNRAIVCVSGGSSSGIVTLARNRKLTCVSGGSSTGVVNLARNRALVCVSGGTSTGIVTLQRNRKLTCVSNCTSSGTCTLNRNRALTCLSSGASSGIVTIARTRRLTCVSTGTSTGICSIVRVKILTCLSTGTSSGVCTVIRSRKLIGYSIINNYPSAVLADSPYLYYRLDETGSGPFKDRMGVANSDLVPDDTIISDVSLVGGVNGSAALDYDTGFTRADSTLTISEVPLTIEAWIKPLSLDFNLGVNSTIVSNGDNGGWQLAYNSTGNIQVVFEPGDIYEFDYQIQVGRRYHIVVVLRADNKIDLYVNGVFVQQITGVINLNASTEHLTLGALDGEFVNKSKNTVDELAIYRSALTAAQIAAHYAEATRANSTGTCSIIRTRKLIAVSTATSTGTCGTAIQGQSAYVSTGTSTGTATLARTRTIIANSGGSSTGSCGAVRNRKCGATSTSSSTGLATIFRVRNFAAVSSGSSTGVCILVRNRRVTCASSGNSTGICILTRVRALSAYSTGSSSGTCGCVRGRGCSCISSGISTGVASITRVRNLVAVSIASSTGICQPSIVGQHFFVSTGTSTGTAALRRTRSLTAISLSVSSGAASCGRVRGTSCSSSGVSTGTATVGRLRNFAARSTCVSTGIWSTSGLRTIVCYSTGFSISYASIVRTRGLQALSTANSGAFASCVRKRTFQCISSTGIILAPFPSTPVLDDFNTGANQNLTARTGWNAVSAEIGTISFKTDAVPTVAQTTSGQHCSNGWGTTFRDAEIWIELGSPFTNTQIQLFARLGAQQDNATTFYILDYQTSGSWSLNRGAPSMTNIKTNANGPVLAAGDSLGLRVNGSTIEAWHKPAAGNWTLVVSGNDSTYNYEGYISVLFVSKPAVNSINRVGGGVPVLIPEITNSTGVCSLQLSHGLNAQSTCSSSGIVALRRSRQLRANSRCISTGIVTVGNLNVYGTVVIYDKLTYNVVITDSKENLVTVTDSMRTVAGDSSNKVTLTELNNKTIVFDK